MFQKSKSSDSAGVNLSDYLTETERKRLLANLHHLSVWVGVPPPKRPLGGKRAHRRQLPAIKVTGM